MLQTDNNEVFPFLTPRSGSLILLLPERHTFLHFLTFFDGSPYLVLLGGRLTVLGHSLAKYESSAILSGRPPTVKIITFLIAYRQLPPLKQKHTQNSNFLFKNLRTFRKLGTLYKIPNFFNFGRDSSDLGISLLPKTELLSKDQKEKIAKRYILKSLNKLLVSKITNPGRVQLVRKLSSLGSGTVSIFSTRVFTATKTALNENSVKFKHFPIPRRISRWSFHLGLSLKPAASIKVK